MEREREREKCVVEAPFAFCLFRNGGTVFDVYKLAALFGFYQIPENDRSRIEFENKRKRPRPRQRELCNMFHQC